jgi:membrane protein
MWRVYGEIEDDRILAVAAGVTFYGLLALFPALAAFVSLYGLVADPGTISEHLTALGGFLPGGALDVISEQVKRITTGNDTALGFAFFSGLAVSLWSANAGVKAVFDALNVAYEEKEKRSFIVLNLVSLAFTFGGIVFIILAMTGIVVVPVILKYIGLGGVTDWLVWIGRWPALLVVTIGALAVLYRYGPSRERAQWRWLAPGGILAAVGWMIFSMLFSWYVGSFGNYNETYGSLGAVVGFLTWMWLSVTIILVGAELNAETEHQTAQDTTEARMHLSAPEVPRWPTRWAPQRPDRSRAGRNSPLSHALPGSMTGGGFSPRGSTMAETGQPTRPTPGGAGMGGSTTGSPSGAGTGGTGPGSMTGGGAGMGGSSTGGSGTSGAGAGGSGLGAGGGSGMVDRPPVAPEWAVRAQAGRPAADRAVRVQADRPAEWADQARAADQPAHEPAPAARAAGLEARGSTQPGDLKSIASDVASEIANTATEQGRGLLQAPRGSGDEFRRSAERRCRPVDCGSRFVAPRLRQGLRRAA